MKIPIVYKTAEEALSCSWFKSNDDFRQTLFENSFGVNMIKRYKKFNTKEKLQQATLAFIIHYLDTNDEILKLKKIFQQINQKMDGKLSLNELTNGLIKVKGHLISENEITAIFKNIDQDKNGFIDIEEFLRASIDYSKILNETNLKLAFNSFDKNKDGKLDKQDISQIFKTTENNTYFEELIARLDIKNNFINYKEFSDLMNLLLQDLVSSRSSIQSLFGMSESSNNKNPKSRFSKETNKDENKLSSEDKPSLEIKSDRKISSDDKCEIKTVSLYANKNGNHQSAEKLVLMHNKNEI
jgi:Ca2+-binding EF-hand superfamily protein